MKTKKKKERKMYGDAFRQTDIKKEKIKLKLNYT